MRAMTDQLNGPMFCSRTSKNMSRFTAKVHEKFYCVYNVLIIKRFSKDLEFTRFAFDIRQSFEAVSRVLKWCRRELVRHTYSGDIMNILLTSLSRSVL